MNPSSEESRPISAPAGDFAKSVSKARHDLRNPLAHVLGFSEWLIERATQQGLNYVKGRLQVIYRLAEELLAQVNQNLDAEKLQAGSADACALHQQLHQHAGKIVQLATALGRKPNLQRDEVFQTDLERIRCAAQELQARADSVLAFLLVRTAAPPADAALATREAPESGPKRK